MSVLEEDDVHSYTDTSSISTAKSLVATRKQLTDVQFKQ